MFKYPDSIAHSANMLVCIGGLATATGAIAGAGAVIGGYLSYREIMKRLPAGAKRLADELQAELAAKLSEPGLNEDTGRLIPQMIEASLPSPQRVMEAGLDGKKLAGMMAARLTDKEHLLPDHLGPFTRIVGHLLERLLADPQFADELGPAFRKQVLADAETIKAGIEGLEEKFGSITQALSQVGALGKANRDQLEALASRFEIDRAFAIGDAELRALLEAKAEEYRSYKAQIDMIDARVAGLGNLKAAAQEATERLDLEEVERLLSMVHATELDIAAKTAELRADNGLLRGRVEEAYRLLSAAADSFAAVDPLEPASRRILYADRLHSHALRYAGSEISKTIEMYRAALKIYSEYGHSAQQAGTLGLLACALQEQGARISGENGTRLLAEAVDLFRMLLRAQVDPALSPCWAETQHNLGNALSEQAARSFRSKQATLHAEAMTAFQAALHVFTEDKFPYLCALTHYNMAIALARAAVRSQGKNRFMFTDQAVKAIQSALRVFQEKTYPQDWASSQSTLANLLQQMAWRTAGEQKESFLAKAVAANRAALRFFTENDYPVRWAEVQMNLSNVLTEQGKITRDVDGKPLVTEAIEAFRSVLRVYSLDEHPVRWAATHQNWALAEEALADHDSCADPRPNLRAALEHLDAALRVFDPEHMPFDFKKAQRSRARIRAKLAALP